MAILGGPPIKRVNLSYTAVDIPVKITNSRFRISGAGGTGADGCDGDPGGNGHDGGELGGNGRGGDDRRNNCGSNVRACMSDSFLLKPNFRKCFDDLQVLKKLKKWKFWTVFFLGNSPKFLEVLPESCTVFSP